MELTPALGVNIKNYSSKILIGKTWRISEKIDGVRRLFYKSKTGRVFAYSRTGKEDKLLTHITSYLELPWYPYDTVYDCELVDRSLYFSKADSFLLRAETTGKANQQYPDNKSDLMAICFDIYTPGGTATGRERDLELKRLFSQQPLTDPIIMVPLLGVIQGEDTDTLNSLMAQVQRYGGEGLMLMDLDSIYIPGRSKTLVKVKRLDEYIGTLVDVEMATDGTKIEGGIAALICQVKGCTVPVRVGTGLTHQLRLEIAQNLNHYMGKKLEIEAFSKTRDARGNTSLSMPVFKQFV